MAVERTLAIIKPDAVAAGNIDAIKARIADAGFSIVKEDQRTLSKETAEQFYAEHKERPFFGGLVEFMTSGEVVVMVLEKENAILGWRELMGATNPADAAEGTLRKVFGTSIDNNATHGSDSPTSSAREIGIIFPEA